MIQSVYRNRILRLKKRLSSESFESVLISSKANCRYLSGFTGSNGYLLITEKEDLLFTDFRYVEQAKKECLGFETVRIAEGYSALTSCASDMKLGVIGFEPSHVSFLEYQRLRSELPNKVKLLPIQGIVEDIRAIKDQEEVVFIKEAVSLADKVLQEAVPLVRPGVSENFIANHIEGSLRDMGAEGLAFDTIVGTGVNAALPHHRADETIIKEGDPVVIDMGALYKGYRSDLTRTFCATALGRNTSKFEEIYGIVLYAQLAAARAAKPGMMSAALDGIARAAIEKEGYGDNFGHGLGHGVGLEIHEKPMVVPASADTIEVGTVFTIEPGIYLPEWGGVRIEDIVLMKEGGPEVLTRSPK